MSQYYKTKNEIINELESENTELKKRVQELEERVEICDRVSVGKDDDISSLKQQLKETEELFTKRMQGLIKERDELLEYNEQLEKCFEEKNTPPIIRGIGDDDESVLKKYQRGDVLMSNDNLGYNVMWSESSFFNIKDLIIRINPKTGRRLGIEDIKKIKDHLRGNYYYRILLDEMTLIRNKSEQLRDQATTGKGELAGTGDNWGIIEEANRLGRILLDQYVEFFGN